MPWTANGQSGRRVRTCRAPRGSWSKTGHALPGVSSGPELGEERRQTTRKAAGLITLQVFGPGLTWFAVAMCSGVAPLLHNRQIGSPHGPTAKNSW